MALCPTPANAGMVRGIVETVDCHIRILVQDSYRDLVGPNTWFAAVFTGMLTIYIALLGYQLMFGRGGLRVTELPFAVLKIGLILAFLTSWAAYQTLIFDLLFEGPAEVMKVLIGPLVRDGAGFNGDVMGGLEQAFKQMSDAASVYGGMASPAANILQGGPMLGSGLLWLTSIALLLSILGLIVAAKIVLAFLLAIGPIFIGMFLFDATRGLSEGWARTTLSFALTPLAVNVFGAVCLMILQPFLDILETNAKHRLFDMGPVITLALIVVVFAGVMAMGMSAVAGVVRGLGGGPGDRRGRNDVSLMLPAPAPETNFGRASSARAEHIAARIAMIDNTRDIEPQSGFREGGSRRLGDITDAVTPASPSGERLGQAYSRTPRPMNLPAKEGS